MAGYGSKKGSNNGGGRIKGQRKGETKKQALERMGVIQHDNAMANVRVATAVARPAGKKLAKEVMDDAMTYFYGLAAKYQPSDTNAEADERKFIEYLEKASDIAGKLAVYQSPRLSNVTQTQLPVDLTRLSDEELDAFERLIAKAALAGGDTGGAGETAH